MIEQFRDWVDHEAPKNSELDHLLVLVKSEFTIVAIMAQALLFGTFILSILLDTKPQAEITRKTTDEVARGVLKDIQSSQPAPTQQPIFEEIEKEAKEIPATEKVSEQQPISPQVAFEQLEIAEVFLNQMQEQTKRRDESITEEMKRLRGQERVVFWGLVVAASTTIVIIVIGIVLIYLNQLAVGIVAEAVGILPGAGTLTLNRQSKKTTTGINRLEALREDNLKVLQAIQATLLIPDFDKRSDAIVSLASRLMDRAMEST